MEGDGQGKASRKSVLLVWRKHEAKCSTASIYVGFEALGPQELDIPAGYTHFAVSGAQGTEVTLRPELVAAAESELAKGEDCFEAWLKENKPPSGCCLIA